MTPSSRCRSSHRRCPWTTLARRLRPTPGPDRKTIVEKPDRPADLARPGATTHKNEDPQLPENDHRNRPVDQGSETRSSFANSAIGVVFSRANLTARRHPLARRTPGRVGDRGPVPPSHPPPRRPAAGAAPSPRQTQPPARSCSTTSRRLTRSSGRPSRMPDRRSIAF
jgi:hypothetical protein